MSEAENLQLARKMWDTWNTHDPASYLKLLDEKYTLESDTVPQPIRGLEAARNLIVPGGVQTAGLKRDFESPMAGRHIHRPTIGAIMPCGSTEYRARETSGSLRQTRQRQSAGCDRL